MKQVFILFSSFIITNMLNAQQIKGIKVNSIEVEQFEKYEILVDLEATYSNPYDYDEIELKATMTSPSGKKVAVDGFYMQDYDLNTSNGNLTSKGNGEWRIRFAPNEKGLWQYEVSLKVKGNQSNTITNSFNCIDGTNKGFVRKNNTNYLNFDSGDQYFPVGQNLCWNNSNPYFSYKTWLDKMGAAKANFMRLWLCHWGLGIEWKKDLNSGYDGLRKYKQNNSWYLDWLVEKCKEKGVYIMFCINHHGQVSSQVNPNWADSPYNTANGGMCAQTWNFFDNNDAKLTHKNRLRYIVARWGYSTQIMSWELFNEVNWTDSYSSNSVKTSVRNWHDEMAKYLKDIDPFSHLVSTSYGKDEDPLLWKLPNMDFTQTHTYLSVTNIEKSIADDSQSFIEDYSKPTICGEFGIDVGSGSGTSSADPKGVHLHNTLWATAFSGAFGSGATWWWDSYTEPLNLYSIFTPVSKIIQKITLYKDNYQPALAQISGGNSAGNLSISPSADWAQSTTAEFTVNNSGISSGKLGQYLYGSQWNTQFRNPPMFNVEYPSNGKFTVKTAGQTGQMARISIYLDGNLILDQSAAVNQNYTIDVPSGKHSIKVDNLGTDWIRIQEYVFVGLGGAPVNTYVLKSQSKEKVAAWVHHKNYNWKDAKNTIPAELKGLSFKSNDVANGAYNVSFYSCTTGDLLNTINVNVDKNALNLELPNFTWDVVIIANRSGEVSTADFTAKLQVNLFPNPIAAGQDIQIATSSLEEGDWEIKLINIEGKVLKQKTQKLVQGENLSLPIQSDLLNGTYFLNISNGKKAITKPFIILN